MTNDITETFTQEEQRHIVRLAQEFERRAMVEYGKEGLKVFHSYSNEYGATTGRFMMEYPGLEMPIQNMSNFDIVLRDERYARNDQELESRRQPHA